jgi:hypothetical protein
MTKEEDDFAKANSDVATAMAALAGIAFHSWLPYGAARKILMLALIGVGAFGLATGRFYLLLAWPLAVTFSPRAVGGLAFFLGRLSAGWDKSRDPS